MLTTIKDITLKIINKVLFDLNWGVLEFFNGVSFIGFGISLLFTPIGQDTLAHSIPSSSFISGPNVICIIMILFGVLKIWALVFGSVQVRKWIAFVATFSWGFLLVVFVTPPYKPTAIFFILELTLFTLWIFIRLVLRHRAERLLDPRDPYLNL